MPVIKIGSKIMFGKYPQTKETNSDIIHILESNWTMDNIVEYNGTKYLKYDYNWYKFEPVVWRVIKAFEGKLLLITDLVIDCIKFYKDTYDRMDFNNLIHPNNWEYSDIRTWLNYEFYNRTFSDAEKEKIVFTEIDNRNSAHRSRDNYFAQVQNNTTDMVYLPSYGDIYYVHNLQDEKLISTLLEKKATDFAKARGAYVYKQDGNSGWWLRSPNIDHYNSVTSVTNKGEISNWGGVDLADIGVVPEIIVQVNK